MLASYQQEQIRCRAQYGLVSHIGFHLPQADDRRTPVLWIRGWSNTTIQVIPIRENTPNRTKDQTEHARQVSGMQCGTGIQIVWY